MRHDLARGIVALALWLAAGAAVAAIWVDEGGRPRPVAAQALALLAAAGDDGLAPTDYGEAALSAQAARLQEKAPLPADSAAFDAALQQALQRYLAHLHFGRVDPARAGFRLPPRDDGHDFAQVLAEAAARERVSDLAAQWRPTLPAYTRLREALATERARAAVESVSALAALAGPTLRPGQAGDELREGLAALQDRLRALGDLAAQAAVDPARYDGGLVEAVRRFQARHGLAPDGVLGRATRAALQVPAARRVRQIELALERMRWLPHLGGRRFVAINIPMFRLWAVDPALAAPPLEMDVIVGRALDTRTPVFMEQMRYLVFRPYWNVPRSIVRNEILPALARNPAYLERHDMELVRGGGDDAPAVAADAAALAALRAGTLRVRQRPGARNSLGLVKFIFPNDDSVYLHGTPAPQLFERARRDFSHGCVRLQDPLALAAWLLRDQPRWTRSNILAAMEAGAPRRVDLTQAVPVVLYYVTAMVFADGLHYADDLYGHDARLDRLLKD